MKNHILIIPHQQEYRYLCRIGCGGVPMRVYVRELGSTSWFSLSLIQAFTATLLGGNQLHLMIRHTGSALFYMSINTYHLPAMVLRDHFGLPFGSTVEFPNPSFILPKGYPIVWMPFYPNLPLPRPTVPRIRIPLPVPVPTPVPTPAPAPNPTPFPFPEPPVIPPMPPTFPLPPSSPGTPPENLSACATYESRCQSGEDYDFGECIFDCIMCCAEMCGPAAYSACAAGCPDKPGDDPLDCGVTIIDPPSIPEDIWDWLEEICNLLAAWEIIPEDDLCKGISWIPLL